MYIQIDGIYEILRIRLSWPRCWKFAGYEVAVHCSAGVWLIPTGRGWRLVLCVSSMHDEYVLPIPEKDVRGTRLQPVD